MEFTHLDALLVTGNVDAVTQLYESYAEDSLERKYMNTQKFTQKYVYYLFLGKSMSEVIRHKDLSENKSVDDYIKENRWEKAVECFKDLTEGNVECEKKAVDNQIKEVFRVFTLLSGNLEAFQRASEYMKKYQNRRNREDYYYLEVHLAREMAKKGVRCNIYTTYKGFNVSSNDVAIEHMSVFLTYFWERRRGEFIYDVKERLKTHTQEGRELFLLHLPEYADML